MSALKNKQRTRALALLIAPLTFLLSGCAEVSGLGFEKGLSSVNDTTSPLWSWSWIAAGVVGIITFILIIWPAIFHRAKASKGEFPKQTQYNIPVEILYTVIPFVIVAVLFYFTATKESKIVDLKTPAQHEIGVEGIQWSWQFSYPEAGEKAVVTGTPENPPTLYIPQGESVRFNITSNDVVHGFWQRTYCRHVGYSGGDTLGRYPSVCRIFTV